MNGQTLQRTGDDHAKPWEGWEYPAGAASLVGSIFHSERRQVWRILESYSDFEENRADIHFIRPGMGRHIQGPAHVTFAPGELRVRGTLDTLNEGYLVAALIAMTVTGVVVSGISLPWRLLVPLSIGLAGIAIVYFMQRRDVRRLKSTPQPYVFRHADLRRAQFYGPIVKLWFRRSPMPGIKMLCIYVPPHFRETFYAEFDRAFPGVLPQTYRRVLE